MRYSAGVAPRQEQAPPAPARPTPRAPVGLDRGAIITAALALIDERGASFTIRDLSARLGVSAPTIYWHVGSKAGLHQAIVDHVVSGMAAAGHSEGPWEERLRQFLAAAREQLLAHPGAVKLMRTVHSPAFGDWAAEALDIMTAAGFGPRDSATYARTTLLHALGSAHAEAGARTAPYMEAAAGQAGPPGHRVRPELLAAGLEPGIAVMTSYDLDEQHEITTGLFIDGLRSALARAEPGGDPLQEGTQDGEVRVGVTAP
jgi:AcrR family transcriptional regulator